MKNLLKFNNEEEVREWSSKNIYIPPVMAYETETNKVFTFYYPESHKIYYTTNDGNIINVNNYWRDRGYQPIINEYDKERDRGVMIFDHELTEIPALDGSPFFFSQTNLLTLKLPKTITRLGHGCFYGCENLYQCNVEDLTELKFLEYGVFELTAIKKLDFRKCKLVEFTGLDELDGQAILRNINSSPAEYVLFPPSIKQTGMKIVSLHNDMLNADNKTRIKTLMVPSLNPIGTYYIEDSILENLIINKFDGLGELHTFNTDCKIWVPDEFYDGYVEKYNGNDNILSRLKKYSEGVPEFPYK